MYLTAASGETSPPSLLDNLESQVRKLGDSCNWVSAAELCSTFVETADAEQKCEALELLGDCLYYSSFQQENRLEFVTQILRAQEVFQSASLIGAGANNSILRKRCAARAGFCACLASDDSESRRRIVVEECIAPLRDVCSEPLEGNTKDQKLTRVQAEFLRYLLVACHTTLDPKQLAKLVKETKIAGKAFLARADPSNTENFIQLTNAYVLFLEWASGYFLGSAELGGISDALIPKSVQLVEMSQRLENKQLASMALETATSIATEFSADFELGASLLQRALALAEGTQDCLLIGRQLSAMANVLLWAQQDADLPEKRRELLNQTIEHASRAIDVLKKPLATFYLSFAYSLYICALTELAKSEGEMSTKMKLLNKAIEAGKEGLCYANASSLEFVRTRFSDALRSRAEMSEYDDERKGLLSESLILINEHILLTKQLTGEDSWNLGLAFRDSGEVKAKLADYEPSDQKFSFFTKSVSAYKTALEMLLNSPRAEGQESSIALTFEDLGDSLVKIHELTHEREYCLNAVEAYERSANYYEKANAEGSTAHLSIYLLAKVATLYDRAGEYENSSTFFSKAEVSCKSAATTQGENLQKSFLGLALFNSANSKIEQARLFHRDEKYSLAIEKLKEASLEFEKTEGYRYLAKHYLACSLAEEGEDQSRKEKNREASEAFENASKLFSESQKDILRMIESMPSEITEKVKNWAEFSDQRSDYCEGRKILALAKSLDSEGEAEESKYKYQAAAKVFRELEAKSSQEDRDELEAMALSCDAWAAMKEAEDRSSPELYAKASDLFMIAKERKGRRSFVLSCLASSAICRAFEAGTRFKQTGQVQLYSEIKKELGSAAQFYEDAGFEIAAGWTSGTEALFDALAYLSSAESEMDPAKKTQMYHLAEKHLELSARRYGEIGYDKKRQEVLKQLKKVRENKEMLLTPMDALSQNPTSYSTPANFTADQLHGFESFEGANLTANLDVSSKTPNVGSLLRVDIDIANVGKSPVLLMKVDNLAPEIGFEPETEREAHHFLQSKDCISIDMRGRRLDYLKTHEMSVHLKVKSKGTFQLKPRILFVDNSGKYHTYDLEPQSVEVKELGFMGWAKGKP